MTSGQRSTGHGPARSQAKERLWRQHVSRQARSELTVRDYCRQAALSEASFYAWRSELARRDSIAGRPAHSEPAPTPKILSAAASFLPVTIGPAAAGPIEVLAPSGLIIRVPSQDAAALRTVLEWLEPRSC
jgi:hypothetical protein